uniref:Saposin B-type domain-containing protein n=1 Tax=Trichobilharzia regenti TaxID=157069 RepID=A0AA85K3K7_TRIRE|nr:unnamed protein product [Trichobilharzia regenti]
MFTYLLVAVFALEFVTSTKHSQLNNDVKNLACQALEFTHEEGVRILKQDKFRENIIKYVLSVTCGHLEKKTERHRCNLYMTGATRRFLRNFVESSKHKHLKSMQNWCKSYTTNLKDDNSTIVCSGCETIVSFLKTMTASQSGKNIIHMIVEKVCALTGAFQTQCSLIGSYFVDNYIQTLADLTSEQVCQKIHICA